MISTKDQEELLKLVAEYLEQDVTCLAIGGTAMMFAGYKATTKDIDLVFGSEQDRKAFIKAIERLGYRQRSVVGVYDEKRAIRSDRPLMYSRGDERFDLFVKNVFGFEVSAGDINQRYDFLGRQELIVTTPSKEEIILLKAITGREKDYEDIVTIIAAEQQIDWDRIIDEAVAQRENNAWILIDLEETMQALKEVAFIPAKHFQRIYAAQK